MVNQWDCTHSTPWTMGTTAPQTHECSWVAEGAKSCISEMVKVYEKYEMNEISLIILGNIEPALVACS